MPDAEDRPLDTFDVIIPARYGSTRFSGKALGLLAGRPLVLHCADRARQSQARRVIVATDDERIAAVCRDDGVEVMLTEGDHASGTDRLSEVATRLALEDAAIVVNMQGDEPLLPAAHLDRVAARLADRRAASMATLVCPLVRQEDLYDPNVVKALLDARGQALAFTRAPVPWQRDGDRSRQGPLSGPYWRHLGVYAYRAGFLRRFPGLESPEWERLEQLEQLRALWHGAVIACVEVAGEVTPGVDTPEQLAEVERLLLARTGP